MPLTRHWIAPLVAAAAVCVVASGIVASLPLPASARALVVLGVVVLAPFLAWHRSRRPLFALEQWLPACLHLLVVLFFLSLFSVGLNAGLMVLGLSLLLGIARPSRPSRPSRDDDSTPVPAAPWVLIPMLALAVWMAATPMPISLRADGPAHLGALHDALDSNRWVPPDHSLSADETAGDPRFGVGHGLLAAIAQSADVAPETVLQTAPVVLCPLWFVAHLQLFSAIGLFGLWGVGSALLFTFAGGGGRSFGLWLVSYPGNIALLFATFAMAGWLRALSTGGRSWLALCVLALSARIHPFGWWLFLVITAHLVVLPRDRDMRAASRARIVLDCLVGLTLGLLVLLPQLLQQGVGGSGPHFEVTDALRLGGPFFVVDPTVLARWSSWAAILMFPALLLLARRSRAMGEQYGKAAALAVWTIALNPLVMPWAWSLVSYLTVRMGRGVPTTAIVLLLLLGLMQSRAAIWRRGLVLAFCALVLLGQARTALRNLRSDHAAQRRFSVEQVEGIADALDTAGLPSPWTDPRTAYGLRALRGGAAPVYPLAHASPTDAELERRLASLRRLHDPRISYADWVDIAREEEIRLLLLNGDQERLSRVDDYGWVASDERARDLARRLSDLGLPPRRLTDDATLFSLSSLPEFGWEPAPAEIDSVSSLEPPVGGVGFRLVGLDVPATARAGETIVVEAHYERDETVVGELPWQEIWMRLEGAMWEAPAPLRPIGKPIRKIFVERSGRSESRFGLRWFPLDGLRPPSAWPAGAAFESRRLVIPPGTRPGRYSVQLSIQTVPWRRNRELSDYLSDVDRYSSVEYGELQVLSRD